MLKLIILIIIVGIFDLRKISLREKKKEVAIYFILCLITLGFGIYYMNPKHVTLSKFILTYVITH